MSHVYTLYNENTIMNAWIEEFEGWNRPAIAISHNVRGLCFPYEVVIQVENTQTALRFECLKFSEDLRIFLRIRDNIHFKVQKPDRTSIWYKRQQ